MNFRTILENNRIRLIRCDAKMPKLVHINRVTLLLIIFCIIVCRVQCHHYHRRNYGRGTGVLIHPLKKKKITYAKMLKNTHTKMLYVTPTYSTLMSTMSPRIRHKFIQNKTFCNFFLLNVLLSVYFIFYCQVLWVRLLSYISLRITLISNYKPYPVKVKV